MFLNRSGGSSITVPSVPLQSPDVNSISLQPGSNNGSVLATACDGGIVRIYDTRRSISRELSVYNVSTSLHYLLSIKNIIEPVVSQMKKRFDVDITSVMFSPVEPTLIAASGVSDGTHLYDIRFPNQ